MIDFNRRPGECAECGGPLEYEPPKNSAFKPSDYICGRCYLELTEIKGNA